MLNSPSYSRESYPQELALRRAFEEHRLMNAVRRQQEAAIRGKHHARIQLVRDVRQIAALGGRSVALSLPYPPPLRGRRDDDGHALERNTQSWIVAVVQPAVAPSPHRRNEAAIDVRPRAALRHSRFDHLLVHGHVDGPG